MGLHVRTLEETTKIVDIYHQHPDVLVLFQYPEHASSSFGIADIDLLVLMSKAQNPLHPVVRNTLRISSDKLKKALNARLGKFKMKECVHSAFFEAEDYYDPTLWFFERDASASKIVWLREKLRRISVYVFIVSYGSDLHNVWNAWVQD